MITSLIGDKTKNDHVDTQWNILTVMEVERSSHCTHLWLQKELSSHPQLVYQIWY